jgi:hypothetical protein
MSFERDREITSDVLFYYERFKFALSQRLYPPERETEFRNRRRKREAYVADCGYVLKRLAMRAFPSISFDSRDIRLIILVVGIH